MAFREPRGGEVRDRLNGHSRVVSSNLLEAELRTAYAREGQPFSPGLVANIEWISPPRSIGEEIEAVLLAGYARGADLWHLACALYVTDRPGELAFVTLDQRQREVAQVLGFET